MLVTKMPAQNAVTLTIRIPNSALNGSLGELFPKKFAVNTAAINANGHSKPKAIAIANVTPIVNRIILIRSGVCWCSRLLNFAIIS